MDEQTLVASAKLSATTSFLSCFGLELNSLTLLSYFPKLCSKTGQTLFRYKGEHHWNSLAWRRQEL